MKPTRNKIYCKNCNRIKMLFETEKKAGNFIKFNREEIESESGYGPQRSYYCLFCGGWHVTSMKEKIGISENEQLLEHFKKEKEKKKPLKITTPKAIVKENNIPDKEQQWDKKLKDLESQVLEMEDSQKENFFLNKINSLKQEIETLEKSTNISDKAKLKDLRHTLQVIYVLRKQNGFQTTRPDKTDQRREKEIEEWRTWAEKQGY